MPDKKDPIQGTLNAVETSADNYDMPADGLFRGDIERVGGTMTVRMNIKIPGGDSYVPARDINGALLSYSLDETNEHQPVEIICRQGTLIQFEATASTSGDVRYSGGRVGDR